MRIGQTCPPRGLTAYRSPSQAHTSSTALNATQHSRCAAPGKLGPLPRGLIVAREPRVRQDPSCTRILSRSPAPALAQQRHQQRSVLGATPLATLVIFMLLLLLLLQFGAQASRDIACNLELPDARLLMQCKVFVTLGSHVCKLFL